MVNTWRIVAAALVIFAAGVLTGGVGAGLAGRVSRQRKAPVVRPSPSTNGQPRQISFFRAPGAARLDLVNRMTRELDLTPEQRLEIDAIVSRGQVRLNDLWQPVAPKAKAEYNEIRKEMNAVLTDEQRERLDAAFKKRMVPRGAATNGVPAQ